MHILILGAGALGSLLGARLAKSQAQVTLFSTNQKHMQTIQAQGLEIIELDHSISKTQLRAIFRPEQISPAPDLVLVLVKSYSTLQAVQSILPSCGQETIFLTLQNGIGNWETIAQAVPQENVLAGITAQGATYLQPGKIRHGGNGETSIGEIQGQASQRVQNIVDIFQEAGLQAKTTNKTQDLLWHKLLINTGINALTAVLRVPNGVIAESEPAQELALSAVQEGLAVAKVKGLDLDQERILQQVLQVARATAQNISSMHQDLLRGRPTEIEAINGALVSQGQEQGVPVTVNQTLTNLVRTAQDFCKAKEGSNA
ncbi:MAG: ketopantoate reductase family protein [Desulfohalobiaceae bacterium]